LARRELLGDDHRVSRRRGWSAITLATCAMWAAVVLPAHLWSQPAGGERVEHPWNGVTHIARSLASPRAVTMHVVLIDLAAAGLRFKLTPPSGTRETVRQTTMAFLEAEGAQVAINSHFFLPFPSTDTEANLVGLAASEGQVYSAFEAPVQSYAIVKDAPAINVDRQNRATLVHRRAGDANGTAVAEAVSLWTAVAGSAQIVTDGVTTIPSYVSALLPRALLIPGGPGAAIYSNANSWYGLLNARTAIGLTADRRTLVLMTVDRAGSSLGMSVAEVADRLVADYGVRDALNLDGGGSTTMAMEDPATHARQLVNQSSDNPTGRAVGSNLAVFAAPMPAADR
jgi:phosphodiester glycosidase